MPARKSLPGAIRHPVRLCLARQLDLLIEPSFREFVALNNRHLRGLFPVIKEIPSILTQSSILALSSHLQARVIARATNAMAQIQRNFFGRKSMNINSSTYAGLMASNTSTQESSGDDGTMGKDDFLLLLTTQLQQQDPLDPTDNSEFVAQLAQFTSLESLENMSTAMGNMAYSMASNTSAQMVSFIGQEVVVSEGGFSHQSNAVEDLAFTLDGDAEKVQINIKDEDGKTVKTLELGAMDAGDQEVSWDGTNDDGGPVPEGEYSFEIVASDAEGEPVTSTLRTTHKVVGVSFKDGFPVLMLENGETTSLGSVLEVVES